MIEKGYESKYSLMALCKRALSPARLVLKVTLTWLCVLLGRFFVFGVLPLATLESCARAQKTTKSELTIRTSHVNLILFLGAALVSN